MGWRMHGCFMGLRTLSFFASHLFWILAILSRCAYFQLWKSYDILWCWVYIITTCVVPRLRAHNLILQCGFLWRKTVCAGERWRYALKEQDTSLDDQDEKWSKITNAIDLGVSFLRLRVSAAILIGNVYFRLNVPKQNRLTPSLAMGPQEVIIDWALFQILFGIDICLFWAMLLLMWCKQCQLCCQLGCFRYYLWVLVVLVIGGILMEAPMYFAFYRMDRTWCNLNLTLRDTDGYSHAPPINATTLPPLHTSRKFSS